MTETLRDILDRVLDQNKFAESKHLALLAASMASIFGVTAAFFLRIATADMYVGKIMLVDASLLSISIIIIINAIWPFLATSSKPGIIGKLNSVNLIYFEDLKQLDANDFLDRLESVLLGANPQESINRNLLDVSFAEQIINVSKIVSRKHRLLRLAALPFTGAVLILCFISIQEFMVSLK